MAKWRPGAEGFVKDKGRTAQSSKTSFERKGRGIGFAKYKNMAIYCAVVAEVIVNTQTGHVRVERAYSAVDAGLIINPNGLKNQIEGGLIQATSWSLLESVNYNSQQINTNRWSEYPILKFSEVPRLEVELINRPSERSLGVGEGAHGPMAAAIANAIHSACGQRLRQTPLKPSLALRT